jgi:hypothetical protein
LSRKCGSLDLSQPYGPSRPVTGIALYYVKTKTATSNAKLVLPNFLYPYGADPLFNELPNAHTMFQNHHEPKKVIGFVMEE